MELKELIEKLEEAQGHSTKGEWVPHNEEFLGHACSISHSCIDNDPVTTIIAEHIEKVEDAQAIATWHNTASDVLRELKRASQLGPSLVRVARLCEELRARATKTEEESARLKRALITTGVQPRLAAAIAEGGPDDH